MENKTKNIIVDFLKKEIPQLLGIYLFGSYAENRVTRESDIDVAFLTLEKIDSVQKWRIQEKLASQLNMDVDLVDIKDASVILRTEIVENGIRIYTGDSFQCDNFDVTTYSLYTDLNESRIHILNDIKEDYGRNSDT